VDESFIDFSDAPSSAHRGCVVLRSLTKFYALPGLRIGAVIGPASLVFEWKRLREPWQVNVLAEAAALAAVTDKEHAVRTRKFVASEKRWLCRQLAGIAGVHPLPSNANYIFCTLDYAPPALSMFLVEHRILVRDCSAWPGFDANVIRVAVRTREENERLLAAWRMFPCD
jgi:threonine-phosphate decarboxylase